jgi:hypothetical protein
MTESRKTELSPLALSSTEFEPRFPFKSPEQFHVLIDFIRSSSCASDRSEGVNSDGSSSRNASSSGKCGMRSSIAPNSSAPCLAAQSGMGSRHRTSVRVARTRSYVGKARLHRGCGATCAVGASFVSSHERGWSATNYWVFEDRQRLAVLVAGLFPSD